MASATRTLDSSDEDDLHGLSTPSACISKIRPQLYVGTFMSEQDRDTLVNNQISHIVQVGSELQPSHPDDFKYLSVSCNDNLQEDVLRILRPCLQFVDEAVQAGGSVLVHCMAGVSRSPALCCAFVMWKQQKGFEDALALVTAAHPPSCPNAVFREQLREFETALNCDVTKLPDTPLTAIQNRSEDYNAVQDLNLDDDDSDGGGLTNNLTEEDWL